MKTLRLLFFSISTLIVFSCSQEKDIIISVKNSIDIERSFETVELTKESLKIEDLSTVAIRNVTTNEILVTQLVDNDGDGSMDELLFQPKVAPLSESKYQIIDISEIERPKSNEYCYSRFVPERTDDYAWENNKVAFRVFGPTAQKMKEDGIDGGTLSSGVDAWLKKVEYPIIDKWYKKYTEGTGSYHEDTGEGLDNFHVGISRGIGGIAVKNNNEYYFSKNFTEYKTITTGPIRTSFYLKYKDWDANGNIIKESKIISLDFGSHFSKYTEFIEGTKKVSAGITLHEKNGVISGDDTKGWVSYWEPHGNSELGMAIVAANNYFIDFVEYDTEAQDLSNVYANLAVNNNKVEYYSGFGWKEAGEFANKEAWETYVSSFSLKINNPLVVSVNN